MVILALCGTAASAALTNVNPVYNVVTPVYQIVTTTAPVYASCPDGYVCLSDADAAARYGTYGKYSDAVCGYKQNPATLAAVIQVPEYCVKQTTAPTPATCPQGCSCMLESAAKDKFQGVYKQCSDKPCATVVTGAAQLSAYCFGPGTTMTTPSGTCPVGCSCISEATAQAQGGSWSRCSADICGYEQSTATLAAVIQVPKYCMKQQATTPVCPDGCSCLSDADAQLKGLTAKCDQNENPCGYQSITATANIQANRIPLYCYKNGITTITPTPICPDNCGGCMNEADAKAKYGSFNYTRCSDKVCGYDQTSATASPLPKYCFRPTITVTPTPAVCPEGCYCMPEAEAKDKFGSGNYARCDPNGQPCGYDQSAASANDIPRYCFKPTNGVTPTPTPAACPQGCLCTTDAIAKEKGLIGCRGTRTSCGYDENKQPLYCFEQNPSPTCYFDYQKNACTGTCQQGSTCGLIASSKDATGKIDYAVCGCTGQPTTLCVYDAQKNACTGTCQSGAACAIVGRNVDEKTGETTPVCGCPQQSSCSYNYDKEACVGTCTATGEACQLNTIYRDATTGKVTYADCHCMGSGDTTSTCALDANNQCSGTCADGGQCTITSTTDASGRVTTLCSCGGQPGTPAGVATQQPGILEEIVSFFSRLFGGK